MPDLKEGMKAPAFSLVATDGKKVSLKDFKGKKLVLYFYPKDMTSGCTKQACDFTSNLSKFKRKKVAVLGVSKDDNSRHKKFTEKYNLKFPLLSDEDAKVCKAYGVYKEKSMYGKKFMGIVRSTFIIDENGKIEKIYSKVKVPGHIDQVLKDV